MLPPKIIIYLRTHSLFSWINKPVAAYYHT